MLLVKHSFTEKWCPTKEGLTLFFFFFEWKPNHGFWWLYSCVTRRKPAAGVGILSSAIGLLEKAVFSEKSLMNRAQAQADAPLCRKIASKKRFIFSLTTVHLVPTQFIFMQNHIPVCQMCTAACEQLLIYLPPTPSGYFFKLEWVGIWVVWKFHFETRNRATPGYIGVWT